MKTIIAGSRSIKNYTFVKLCIESTKLNITKVISGTAKGVDQCGERWANENNIPLEKIPAKWHLLGKSAGIVRNKVMVDRADALIAIWDGQSNGTKFTIEYAKQKGLQVFVFRQELENS